MRETTKEHASPYHPDRGPWIRVRSGTRVYFQDPQPDEIHLGDITWALGCVPRFAGHARETYTVAQHSVLVLEVMRELLDTWVPNADPDHRQAMLRTALLHDAPEAYLGDVVSPLKRLLTGYKEIELAWWSVMATKWQLLNPMPSFVKMIDTALLHAELAFLFGDELVESTGDSNALLAVMTASRKLATVWSSDFARHRMNQELVELGLRG